MLDTENWCIIHSEGVSISKTLNGVTTGYGKWLPQWEGQLLELPVQCKCHYKSWKQKSRKKSTWEGSEDRDCTKSAALLNSWSRTDLLYWATVPNQLSHRIESCMLSPSLTVKLTAQQGDPRSTTVPSERSPGSPAAVLLVLMGCSR